MNAAVTAPLSTGKEGQVLDKFDRQGAPLELMEWARLFEDAQYKRVAETTLQDGKYVSTVWLGLDHRFGGDGLPLIFETMVFPTRGDCRDLDCARYSTEENALNGHNAMVKKWQKEEPDA